MLLLELDDAVAAHARAAGRFGDGVRARTERQQGVRHLGGTHPDHLVSLTLVGTQFKHVTQHGDLAPVQFAEQVERRQHRLGRGIVGVVEDQRTRLGTDRHQAQLRMSLAQPVEDLLPGQPFGQADRRGAQGSMHRMPPDHRDAQVQRLAVIVQAKADAVQAEAFDVVSPQFGFGRQSVEEDARAGLFFHLAHPRVIKVQDGHATLGQRLHKFGLANEDILLRACPFGVDRANIADHADLRLGNVAQEGNFARHVESHFEHGAFVACA